MAKRSGHRQLPYRHSKPVGSPTERVRNLATFRFRSTLTLRPRCGILPPLPYRDHGRRMISPMSRKKHHAGAFVCSSSGHHASRPLHVISVLRTTTEKGAKKITVALFARLFTISARPMPTTLPSEHEMLMSDTVKE